jgi:hypothetical protein
VSESELIAKYEKGISKVFLYNDRIEVGNPAVERHVLGEISEISIEGSLIGWQTRFHLSDGSSSTAIMENDEVHIFRRDLADFLRRNPTPAGASLLEKLPINCFFHKGAAVIVYTDRVDLRAIVSLTSHRADEIREAKIERSAFMWSMWLVMHNGTESSKVFLGEEKTKACHQYVEKFLHDYREIHNSAPTVVIKCSVLGGTNAQLKQGASCTASFNGTVLQIKSDLRSFELPLAQLVSLDIDGPGRVESGGGIIGGGLGVQGALVGMGIAALANTLTARSTTNTFLHLKWIGGELFLHTSSYTPQQARIMLSHVYSIMQAQKAPVATDIVSQLERLKALKDSGILNDEDFALAKTKILNGT